MPLFFEINILLDVSLISLSMFYFLKQSELVKCKNNIIALFGAVAFSLSSYIFSYQSCVMWINSIIFLPLVVLGFERIILGNGGALYYISLLLAIISNYYIGIIIVLFLFVLGIFWLIFTRKDKFLLKRCSKLISLTLLVLTSSTFILLPSYFAQKEVEQSKFSLDLYNIYPLHDLLKSVIINSYTNNSPLIFCGIVTIFLVILFIFNDKVAKREKLFFSVLVIFLCMSTEISYLYMSWHMFTMPNAFPQRESFVISFVLVTVAVKEFSLLNENLLFKDKVIVLISGILWVGLLIIEYLIYNLSIKFLLLNTLVILFYIIIFLFITKKKSIAIMCLISLECVLSGWALNKDTKFANYSDVHTVNLLENKEVETIKNRDKGFYRIGTTAQVNSNDPMTYHYNGLSGYLSQQPTKMIEYLAYLGYFQKYSWYRWTQYNNGSTRAIDRLLGVKYVLAGSQKINKLTKDVDSSPTLNDNKSVNRYSKIFNNKNFTVYKNKNVFPFIMDSSRLSKFYCYNPLENPFNNYNYLFSVFSQNKLYSQADMTDNEYISQNTRLVREKVKGNGLVYIYIARGLNEYLNSIKISVNNGKVITYAGENINGENGILCIGNYRKGENISISFTSPDKIKNKIYCYQENEQLLSNISKKQWSSFHKHIENINIKSNQISFDTYYKKNTYLTLPIFNQKGWQVYINGKRSSLTSNFGALLAFKIPEGENKVRVIYKVPMLKLSLWISIFSIFISVIYLLISKELSNKHY